MCFPLSLVVLHISDFFPPLVFVHCPHSCLLQHTWLLLVVAVVGGGGGGGGGCCRLGLFCELTAAAFVNDVAVLLSLNQRAEAKKPKAKNPRSHRSQKPKSHKATEATKAKS